MPNNSSHSFKGAALTALVSLAASACGGEAPPDPDREPRSGNASEVGDTPEASEETEVPLCDGSDGLVLRVFLGGGGQPFPGHEMQMENGYPSFALDGQCRYFIGGGWQINAPDGRDEGWREGLLDNELARSLQRSIGGADLSGLGACEPHAAVPDAPSLYISNAHFTFTCWENIEGAQALLSTLRRYAPTLQGQGQMLAGDLYVKVVEGANADFALDWPTSIPLPEVNPGYVESRRAVIPAAEAAPVRALRERWLQGSVTRNYHETGIPVRSGERLVRVFLRDALPNEEATGILPLPPPL